MAKGYPSLFEEFKELTVFYKYWKPIANLDKSSFYY